MLLKYWKKILCDLSSYIFNLIKLNVAVVIMFAGFTNITITVNI